MPLGLEIAVGVILLVGLVLAVVFTIVGRAVRRSLERQQKVLEAEGIVRDSGPCRVTARYRRFRSPGWITGAGVRVGSGRLLLTRAHLAVLGVRGAQPVPLAELHRYRFAVDGDRLVVTTDEPVGATGRLELRFRVPDPAAWLAVLEAAAPPSSQHG